MTTWTQTYDPFGHWWLSTLVAALPIIVLFTLLAGLHVRPHLCALVGAATAIIVGIRHEIQRPWTRFASRHRTHNRPQA